MRRLVRYRLFIPVFRSTHPPEHTARGVANGVFWGMTPFMGFQTMAILSTWQILARVFHKESSVLQAMIWAWVNNPVTMIPMYYVFYVTGLWFTGAGSSAVGYHAFVALWDATQREPSFIARVFRVAVEIGLPLSLGSLPWAAAGAALAYWWALTVSRARRRRITARRPAEV